MSRWSCWPCPSCCRVLLILGAGDAPTAAGRFYRQARVGRGGRIYRIWKLRSMVMNADQKLEAHLAADPAARAEWDETQKLKRDPRITRFGRLIRKSSLDELPQLWNVLIGDMSLVGPRPMMPDQRALYPGRAYYALRPGITGPWQVSERNATSFADRARFDDKYHDRDLSLATDVRLLRPTVKRGAARHRLLTPPRRSPGHLPRSGRTPRARSLPLPAAGPDAEGIRGGPGPRYRGDFICFGPALREYSPGSVVALCRTG